MSAMERFFFSPVTVLMGIAQIVIMALYFWATWEKLAEIEAMVASCAH